MLINSRLPFVFTVVVWLVGTAMLSPSANAQRYPFFVQPISVDELQSMGEELKLSPSQMQAVLGFHEAYGKALNNLQEGELKELVDRWLEMASRMDYYVGQDVRKIPHRKEIEAIIPSARRVWDAFERIDKRFFGEVQSVLDEGQFAALERIQFRRRVDAYRQVHMWAVQEFNQGVRVNLQDMIRRLELSRLEIESVGEVMLSYEKTMVGLCRKLESELLEVVDFVLDEIDRRGLQDIGIREMGWYLREGDPQRQEELKAIFNAQSQPLQASAARMSQLNWQTYKKLQPLLPSAKQLELQERYFRQVYSFTANPVFDTRRYIKRVMDLPSVTPLQRSQITPILDQLNRDFAGVEAKIAKAYEDKRAYRTADQMAAKRIADMEPWERELLRPKMPEEDSDLVEAQAKIDRLAERVQKMAEAAWNRTIQLLTDAQREIIEREMLESKDSESSSRTAWGRGGGGRGGSGGGQSSDRPERSSTLASKVLSPLSLVQATQCALWVGLSKDDLPILESLHEAYLVDYDAIWWKFEEAYQAIRSPTAEEFPEYNAYRKEWQRRKDQTVKTYRDKFATLEDQFFDDLSASLPSSVDDELVGRIRRAHDRALERTIQRQGDVTLRRRPEAFIDVAALVLASDPTELSSTQRTEFVSAMGIYEEQVVAQVELLGQQIEKLQSVDGYYSPWQDNPEMDEILDEVSATALRLTEINREAIEGLLGSLSEDRGWPLREQYEKDAYPGVFQDASALEDIFVQVLQLESVTPAERQELETFILDHRSQYRAFTDEILDMAKQTSLKGQQWPPRGEQLNDYMQLAQLEYQRDELNARTRIRLRLLLGDDRTVTIDGLAHELLSGPLLNEGP